MKNLSSLAGTRSLDPIKIKKCLDKTAWIKKENNKSKDSLTDTSGTSRKYTPMNVDNI